ncbi:MAG: hypothetical protein ACRDQX_01690 [Pseudonocardiaceae bacterium]
MPYLVAGVLLVVAGAAGVLITVAQVGQRSPVLVLARPVVVGHVLAAGDLRAVSMSTEPGVDVVTADQARTVVGQPVGYSLPAGVVLPRAVLGAPRTPPAGQGVVAVAAAPGQFPPQLAPGTTVSIIHNAPTGLSAVPVMGGPWTAVVCGIAPMVSDQVTVISLQLPAQDARQVATIPSGQLSIVAEAAGGR